MKRSATISPNNRRGARMHRLLAGGLWALLLASGCHLVAGLDDVDEISCVEPTCGSDLGGPCATNADCASNYVCKANICATGLLGEDCDKHAECAGYFVCNDHVCAKADLGDPCGQMEDCAERLKCEDKACVKDELPPECVPSMASDVVSNDCGIFVSTSLGNDDTGKGTKEAPYQTITGALAKIGDAEVVYLCNETYTESVVLPGGTAMFGGLDCANGWVYDASNQPSIEGLPEEVALTVEGAGKSRLEDIRITSADLAGVMGNSGGASSIAVVVDGDSGASADFARCTLTSGSAFRGAGGDAPPDAVDKAGAGNDGGDACTGVNAQIFGGEAKANMVCATSIGGSGGNGVSTGNGGDGQDGEPLTSANNGLGEGAPMAMMACTTGNNGDPGAAGQPGAGGSSIGTLSAMGYIGADGEDGELGAHAQGGGGGGGAKGGMICMGGAQSGPGASGGSGGPGGCGDIGGMAGQAGGASIALVSLNAVVTLTECILIHGSGGDGGAGTIGQAGQPGGDGGNGGAPSGVAGSKAACGGGDGGQGGLGGPGGGGRGGHTLGVAYSGMMPTVDAATTFELASGAFPGAGGTSPMGNAGEAGLNADMLDFTTQ